MKASIPGTRRRRTQPTASSAADSSDLGSARGGSRSVSTGMTVHASMTAMHANIVAHPAFANTHSSRPPPRIMPIRYAPTCSPFASPRSRESRIRTASPSVAMSWHAAIRLKMNAAASSTTRPSVTSTRDSSSAPATPATCNGSSQALRVPLWSTNGAQRNFSAQGRNSRLVALMAFSE